MTTIQQSGDSGTRGTTSGPAAPSLAGDARRTAEAVARLLSVLQFRDRDRVSPYGLTASQWYALRAVVESGRLTVNQLAGVIHVDKSTASRIASGLADREILVRGTNGDDARAVWLGATPTGRALCSTIQADEERDFAAMLGEMDPEVRAQVCRAVVVLAESADASVESSGGSCWVVK